MPNYGHAPEMQRTQPPLSRLDYLVRQLGLWAKANPALLSLYSEFGTIAGELREAGAGDIPAELGHDVTPVRGKEGTWRCSCSQVFTSTSGFGMCPDDPRQGQPLPLVGHDLALIQGLANSVNKNVTRHSVTRLSKTKGGRGFSFEAHLVDAGGVPTSRVARVTVELDRVYRYCETHGRQHDDDGDRTCRWS